MNISPPDSLYITFEDKSIYQIHRTLIRFRPNQNLMTNNYLRYYGGSNSDNTPILMNPEDGQQVFVMDGYDEYELSFTNNIYKDKEIEEKFNKQFFIIGDVKFKLVQYVNEECWAVGHRFNKK